MKKSFVFCLVAILAFSFAACGSQSAAVAASSGSASVPASSTSVASGSVSASQTTAVLQGVLNDVAMSTITITTDEGREVSFLREDVAMPENMLSGSRVVLTYSGSLVGDTAENARLLRVELLENMATGTVSEASMRFFLLTLEDGTQLEMTLSDDSVVDLPNGLADGEKVLVSYTFSEEDGNAAVAKTVRAAQ